MKKPLLLILFFLLLLAGAYSQPSCGGPCGGFTNASASVCAGNDLTFTTTYTSGVSWSVNSSLLIVSSASNSITVRGVSAGAGMLCMSYNANGTVCSVCKPITVTVNNTPFASVANFVAAPDLSYVKINALPASSSLYYTWFIDGVQYGSEMLGGMQIAYPANCSQIYQVYVKIRNSCGVSTSSCKKFTLDCTARTVTDLGSCGSTGGGGVVPIMIMAGSPSTQVFPNPVKEEIQVDFPTRDERKLILLDNTGAVVVSQNSSTESDKINLSGLKKGIYFLKIHEGNKVESHRIEVE
jgi:hypothetical protein